LLALNLILPDSGSWMPFNKGVGIHKKHQRKEGKGPKRIFKNLSKLEKEDNHYG
jgi:hypothetical protein